MAAGVAADPVAVELFHERRRRFARAEREDLLQRRHVSLGSYSFGRGQTRVTALTPAALRAGRDRRPPYVRWRALPVAPWGEGSCRTCRTAPTAPLARSTRAGPSNGSERSARTPSSARVSPGAPRAGSCALPLSPRARRRRGRPATV